jgi:GT2 family glycosyltransferase
MIQIIIPVYNGLELLKKCVNAVRGHTYVDYELIVADDNSPDANIKSYCRKEKIRFVQNGSGVQGFPHNCNWAAKESNSEFICLLNSDTEVLSGWLDAMKEEMVEPSVGIVGAKLIYPMAKGSPWGGTIQHAGVARNDNGMPYHIYRGLSPRQRCVNVLTECNAVTFACALIRRRVWDDLGGLDEGYVGGQFEDVAFCYESRNRGWRVIYTP